MPKKKPSGVPPTGGGRPLRPQAPSLPEMRAYAAATGARIDNPVIPHVPAEGQTWPTYFVQSAHSSGTGWGTAAAYPDRAKAEEYAAALDAAKRTHFITASGERGEDVPGVSVSRVVTLMDLIEEGPMAVGRAVMDLCTSDYEWSISTELGSELKMALCVALAEAEARMKESDEEVDDG